MHMFPWEYPLKETEIIVLIEIMIFFFTLKYLDENFLKCMLGQTITFMQLLTFPP